MRDADRIARELIATGKWGGLGPRIAERAGYKCEYCDLDLLGSPENYKLWQTDHIVPVSAGGTDDFDNLALACRHCNCDWKGKWNPAARMSPGVKRADLIAAVRKEVSEQRARTHGELENVWKIVGYCDGKIADWS